MERMGKLCPTKSKSRKSWDSGRDLALHIVNLGSISGTTAPACRNRSKPWLHLCITPPQIERLKSQHNYKRGFCGRTETKTDLCQMAEHLRPRVVMYTSSYIRTTLRYLNDTRFFETVDNICGWPGDVEGLATSCGAALTIALIRCK